MKKLMRLALLLMVILLVMAGQAMAQTATPTPTPDCGCEPQVIPQKITPEFKLPQSVPPKKNLLARPPDSPVPSPEPEAPPQSKKRLTIIGQWGIHPQGYMLNEVGVRADIHPQTQQWVEAEFAVNDRLSLYYTHWTGVSFHKNPGPGFEDDNQGGVRIKGPRGINIKAEFAHFNIQGPTDIVRLNFLVGKPVGSIGPVSLSVDNSSSFFRSTNLRVIPGGFVNKLSLSANSPIPKSHWTASGSVSIGADSNPFQLGGGPGKGNAGMFYYTGKLSRPMTEKTEFFFQVGGFAPAFGETIRVSRTWAGIGVFFKIR